jgi:hypothetical protein
VAAGPGAERLAAARSLAELPGLVADIAGVDGAPYGGDRVPPLPVAQFDPPVPPREDPRTRYAIDRWELDEAAVRRMCGTIVAAVDGRTKLVVSDGEEQFHDLDADPLEERPLRASDVDAGAVARLREALAHPATATLTPQPATMGAEPSADELAELEERMRLLGYL